ncbi:MAG: hypothetical protein ACRYGR_09125 [Janthinobacterium lividum]
MAGRIISTSPLATQSDIHKFCRLKSPKHRVNLHDYTMSFCAKNRWVFATFSSTDDIRFITS